jgi:hypothetical protein
MEVVSSARKLIFRPEAGAAVIPFPVGAIVNDYGVNNTTPTVVVQNGTEETPSWQGVDHDSGVVIVNEVPEDVANTALDIFDQGGRTNAALADALNHLKAMGCVDQYTTSLDFVCGKLSRAGRMLDGFTGIVKRDDRDMIPVWKEGDTIFVLTDGVRDIVPEILVRTYRNPDGSEIDINAIEEKS